MRTPFCGKPGCERPPQKIPVPRDEFLQAIRHCLESRLNVKHAMLAYCKSKRTPADVLLVDDAFNIYELSVIALAEMRKNI